MKVTMNKKDILAVSTLMYGLAVHSLQRFHEFSLISFRRSHSGYQILLPGTCLGRLEKVVVVDDIGHSVQSFERFVFTLCNWC